MRGWVSPLRRILLTPDPPRRVRARADVWRPALSEPSEHLIRAVSKDRPGDSGVGQNDLGWVRVPTMHESYILYLGTAVPVTPCVL